VWIVADEAAAEGRAVNWARNSATRIDFMDGSVPLERGRYVPLGETNTPHMLAPLQHLHDVRVVPA
jgi:hypothetical protein